MEYDKKIKYLYLLGILCLIPGIGLFVGILLMFYGIVRYKNKVLILLGGLGIAITFIIYLLLFNELRHGSYAKGVFTDFARKDLNNIVISLKKYKGKYGYYPNSLQELKLKDSFLNIRDPLLLRSSNDKDKIFIYQKQLNGYKLFSVGNDGIAHTYDDIFPDTSYLNSP